LNSSTGGAWWGVTAKKMGYCQSCIGTGVDLKLTLMRGRPYWLCKRCLNPLPKDAWDVHHGNQAKAWGASKYRKKGK